MARLDAAIPTSPLVDGGGNIRPEWRAFFTSLWIRTGGALGQSSDTAALEAQLAAEETARVQADTNLGTALVTETQARTQGDNNSSSSIAAETRARVAGDNALAATDATLVPKSQLCSLWAACDLSFLPVADPGHGMPWLNGGVVTVGTPPTALVGVGLEDSTGDWTEEDVTGHWLYG